MKKILTILVLLITISLSAGEIFRIKELNVYCITKCINNYIVLICTVSPNGISMVQLYNNKNAPIRCSE